MFTRDVPKYHVRKGGGNSFFFRKEPKSLTGLDQPDIQNFVDLGIVGSYVKNTFRRVLDASDVDRYEILAHLLPFYRACAAS